MPLKNIMNVILSQRNCSQLAITFITIVPEHFGAQYCLGRDIRRTAKVKGFKHNLIRFIATLELHLEFSALLKIWQVPAWKIEPRSGYIMTSPYHS